MIKNHLKETKKFIVSKYPKTREVLFSLSIEVGFLEVKPRASSQIDKIYNSLSITLAVLADKGLTKYLVSLYIFK